MDDKNRNLSNSSLEFMPFLLAFSPPMNPSPSFTFLPSPNPTYQFHPQQLVHPPPFSSTTASATLSTLKQLVQLCKSTLQSVSNLFPPSTSTSIPFSTCPFNSHHRIPPQSLFRHYLQCPSSPATIDLTLLDSLHYPNSLLPVDALVDQNKEFVQSTLPSDFNSEFFFSLDEYPNPSNFFYTDCPGVVTFPRVDNTSRILSLPVVLAAECANFKGNELASVDTVNGFCTGFLPSELWFLKSEVNGWNEFPPSYSPAVVRAILHASVCLNREFPEWVIANSPLYGFVIDVYIRDHICLLFRLCFKAITREAISLLSSCSNGQRRGAENSNCPILISVLTWLASQLAILYGDVKGKLFVIDMFKQCLLLTLPKSLSMFSEEQNRDDILEERLRGSITKEGSTTGLIFVSQVAAAVAALHERFILEAKIKAIWGSQSLPSHQRASEHGLISKSADEERRKRENYKPIVEHDGFLWQRTNNQEASKSKSREELLAEERDYKRRRMSYRGKKIKRSTTQVMRDIIEEYMEDIKQASGNGHFLSKDVDGLASGPFALHNISTDDETRIGFPNSSEINKVIPRGDRKESTPDNNITLARSENNSLEDKKKQKRDSRGHHMDQGHTTGRKRYEQEFYSRHTDGQRGNSPSHEDVTDRRQLNKFRRSRICNPLSPRRDQMQSEHANCWRNEVHENLELRDSRLMSRDRTKRSVPAVHSDFEERYDPSKSRDLDEDGLFLES